MKTYLFFRDTGFYPVELADDAAALEGVKLNPGTLKIEDAETQRIIWQADPTPNASQVRRTPEDARKMAANFLTLPFHRRVEIASSLGLAADGDSELSDIEQAKAVFRRATENNKVAELETALSATRPASASPSGYPPVPIHDGEGGKRLRPRLP